LSYFTTDANLDELALKIIPTADPGLSAEQIAGINLARQQLKDGFLKEFAAFVNTGMNDIFGKGIPIINDGGAALQTAWKAETAS